jgi:prepilin-type processing-associated H-X9-DG protein
VAENGNRDHPLKNNSFMQFSVLSNFIASPKVLMDAAEDRLSSRVATHWGNNPNGGLLHPSFANNSVSYFLGMDGIFSMPRVLLSGDRNVTHNGPQTCSSGVAPVVGLFAVPSGPSAGGSSWTNAVHGLSGNLLFYDGSVQETDTGGLRKAVMQPDFDFTYHILPPF